MKNESIIKVLKWLMISSLAAILMGLIFKFQHFTNGELIYRSGLAAYLILSGVNYFVKRKKVIPQNKEQVNN